MKKIIAITLLLLAMSPCRGQQYTTKVFKVFTVKGSDADLKNAENVAATFNFDSIGKQSNMKTEDDYIRFKMLNASVKNKAREGAHWKKLYDKDKALVYKKFDKFMKSRLKKRKMQVSLKFQNTPYKLIVYFIEDLKNKRGQTCCAVFQFVDANTRAVVTQYYIEPKDTSAPYEALYKTVKILVVDDYKVSTMMDLCIAMANYLEHNIE
jgi:hypothetical protein